MLVRDRCVSLKWSTKRLMGCGPFWACIGMCLEIFRGNGGDENSSNDDDAQHHSALVIQ
jgi:hypothetical protein